MKKLTKLKPKVEVEKSMRDGTEGEWLQQNPWDATIELKHIGGEVEVELIVTTSGSSKADAMARCRAGVEQVCAVLSNAIRKW